MSRSCVERAAVLALCACFTGALGCKAPPNQTPPSAASAAPVASVAAPVAKQKPWFSGAFSGRYTAERQVVDIKVGAVREWGKDDGKQASGPGTLTLQIDDDGVVDGTTSGPLGSGRASGKVEDETLRVQLTPSDEAGLHGVLIAQRAGTGFKGAIQASTGNSLQVRQATVDLDKQAN